MHRVWLPGEPRPVENGTWCQKRLDTPRGRVGSGRGVAAGSTLRGHSDPGTGYKVRGLQEAAGVGLGREAPPVSTARDWGPLSREVTHTDLHERDHHQRAAPPPVPCRRWESFLRGILLARVSVSASPGQGGGLLC